MRSPIRLTKFWQKLLFVVAIIALSWVLLGVHLTVGRAVGTSVDIVFAIASQLVLIGAVWFGSRIFRRADSEEVEPPRARWRATARPIAGYLVAAYLLIGVVYALAGGIGSTVTDWLSVVVGIALAAFYLNSSIRLSRNRALWTNPSVRAPGRPA
jgi:predicted Co/Zn/Cd cation transporter (cation efflux family)